MNWKRIIQALVDKGMTQREIAGAVGIGLATVNDLLHGRIKEPAHSKGEALLKLLNPQKVKP
jgi:transcriptional regulator with XRE-family HTH domain